MRKKNISALFLALTIISSNALTSCGETATKANEIVLNVYNSADYIKEDDADTNEKGLITQFEDYCLKEYNQKVRINYSTFDTNETMLSELKTGKANYDLVCPSDYVIQKMIKEDMIEPFIEEDTPNYNQYVSPFVKEKMNDIEVNGKKNIVNQYARGYMWGTLGILYNSNYKALKNRNITSEEMDEDMTSWSSLWNKKYNNLLAIKDSVRDTYAPGIFYTYNDDFTLNDKEYDGLKTLKEKYESKQIDATTYNEKVTEIFNLCDDTTMNRVADNLVSLKENAFGFEVDSGKTDMVKGDKFAINIAWSGDAAYAMDLADEYNESGTIEGEEVDKNDTSNATDLKYVLPDTGANIWFDGWVMPKGRGDNKIWAERFVDFLSMPTNAAQNMEYIGYTSVIAGDDVLSLVQSWYDVRYDEESESIDRESINIDDEDFFENYYTKDIGYFFDGTLEELKEEDTIFYLDIESKNKQFDTQYPDSSILPRLAIMADFGEQNASMLLMWESVKNTSLPLWSYILILVVVILIIAAVIFNYIRKAAVRKRRKERKLARENKSK